VFRVLGTEVLGTEVLGTEVLAQGSRFWVQGFESRVSAVGFRVKVKALRV